MTPSVSSSSSSWCPFSSRRLSTIALESAAMLWQFGTYFCLEGVTKLEQSVERSLLENLAVDFSKLPELENFGDMQMPHKPKRQCDCLCNCRTRANAVEECCMCGRVVCKRKCITNLAESGPPCYLCCDCTGSVTESSRLHQAPKPA